MDKPQPILVADLFPEILDALLELLDSLSPDDWTRPTAATGWSVHDVALHLLGDDIGILSRRRDNWRLPSPALDDWDTLVAYLNGMNNDWVRVLRRASPALVCEFLSVTGEETSTFFQSLDPFEIGGAVSWAGPAPAPVWLDVAREYTERWHHQQHIRDAVARPGLTGPRYLAPVLAAFVHALPHTYRNVQAPQGTSVTLTITGPSGGAWSVAREPQRWQLYAGKPPQPTAEVTLPEDIAWRLFTKGLTREAAQPRANFSGDMRLAAALLETVAIIA